MLKRFVFVLSLISFAIQCKLAFDKLTNPPTATTTDEIKILEVNPPLVTICKDGQKITDPQILDKSLANHLRGIIGNGTISWVGTDNKSMIELVEQWNSDYQIDDKNPQVTQLNGKTLELKKVYLPEYGICWETDEFDPLLGIQVTDLNKFYVFVTDQNLRTYSNIAFSTHSGPGIGAWYGSKLKYKVKVKAIDHNNPVRLDICSAYTPKATYSDCINDKLKKMLLPKLGCVPPWLSPDNQCQDIYTGSNFEKFNSILNGQDFTENIIEQILSKEQIVVHPRCKQPCITTTNYVELKFRERLTKLTSIVIIKFEEEALLTKTVITYYLSDFVVDIGSLLGFWLGLSIFGLTNILENLFTFFKSLDKRLF